MNHKKCKQLKFVLKLPLIQICTYIYIHTNEESLFDVPVFPIPLAAVGLDQVCFLNKKQQREKCLKKKTKKQENGPQAWSWALLF